MQFLSIWFWEECFFCIHVISWHNDHVVYFGFQEKIKCFHFYIYNIWMISSKSLVHFHQGNVTINTSLQSWKLKSFVVSETPRCFTDYLRESTKFDSFWRNISKKTFSLSEIMLLKLRNRVCQNAVESPSKRHPHFPQTKAEIGARPFENQ